jgi:transposase
LVTQGVVGKVHRRFLQSLDTVRLWDGSELGPHLKQRLIREYERLQVCQTQIDALEAMRRRLVDEQCAEALAKIAVLLKLRGIGMNSAWVLGMEWFGWRKFRNRREVGSLAGLDPTPYQSGEGAREQGISKAGHGRVRWLMVEIAWGWLRYQPDSELSRWYCKEFAGGGKRMRRIGIVAMARKLLIALWKYVEFGVIPEGATFKVAR